MLSGILLLSACTTLPLSPAAGDPVETTTDEPDKPQEVKRPSRNFLRQNEDWSSLAGVDLSATSDFWDRIKYIPLDDSRSTWLSVGGHVRVRSETWGSFNFGRPAGVEHNDTFVLSRALLHADLHLGESLRAYVEGKTAQTTDRDLPGGTRTADADYLDLQQGFIDWTTSVAGKTTFRAGRQMLSFGKQRLVSPLPWANTLRTWEGLTAMQAAGDWSWTGLFTRFVPVDIDDFNEGDDANLLYGLYGTHKGPGGKGGQDYYWLGIARQDQAFNGTTGDEFRQTLGTRLWGPMGSGGTTWEFEGAGQVGELGGEDIVAWMVASEIGTPLGGADSSVRGRVGLDWASGDDAAGGDVGTFNQLFPLGHAYYGYIDTVGRQNAIDASAGLEWKATSAVTTSLDWHFFWLADNNDALYNAGGGVVVPGGSSSSTELGNEIDLLATWRLDGHASAMLGYSHYFAGDVLSDTGPDEDIDFLYVGLEYWF